MTKLRSNSFDPRRNEAVRLTSVACLFFLAGLLFQARISRPAPIEAASEHTYQLMVYHTLPGKAPALESIFRDVSKLQSKHGLNAVGYWVPQTDDPAWKDTFVYLLAHSDQESAEANWNSLHADPAFPPYFEAAAPLIKQADGAYQVNLVYMRPTDYSAAK
jgi:NIPSNAP